MEKFKIIILVVAVLGVMVSTVLITSNAEATSGSWEVTCNYDADGWLTGFSCTSDGDRKCECRNRRPVVEVD